METVDFISTLCSSFPLPQQATNVDETILLKGMPDWFVEVSVNEGLTSPRKVMDKKISSCDVNCSQNRFMIGKKFTIEQIVPMMTAEEIVAANLSSTRRRLSGSREGEASMRMKGRKHEGLEVMVYNRNGWGCLLYLTRWDSHENSVLKGRNYREFCVQSHFYANNLVEMWACRARDGKLCFVIENKIDLNLKLSH